MLNLLNTVKGHLDQGGLFDGWSVVFYRWYDDDTAADASPTVLIRPDGGGTPDPYGQRPDVVIAAMGAVNDPVTPGDLMQAVKLYLLEHHAAPQIINFEILGDVAGPMMSANGRPVYQLNVRCWTENL